jgi:hypothetical protein
VPEEPPDLRPEGDNAQWIPGYWAWDADQNQFLWVSGVWRNAPPGQTYVAGYWVQEGDGWRWVSGFWTDGSRGELSYDPQPPASLEVGPSLPAPDDNSVYSPGTWAYQQSRFAWRPGTWMAAQPDMVWVPAHYAWAPAGYLLVAGYWDYPLEQRGVLFAPVVFSQPLWQQPGWVYRPAYVVDTAPLLGALFIGPRWGSYYFGNFYGRAGFEPWIRLGPRRFDPLLTFYSFRHRGNPAWAAGLRQLYFDRLAGRIALPPRTLRQQVVVAGRSTVVSNVNASLTMVRPLTQINRQAARLTTLTATQRQAQLAAVQRLRQSAVTRRQVEVQALRTGAVVDRSSRATLRLSSVTARPAALANPILTPRTTIRDTQINRSSSTVVNSPGHRTVDINRNATINRQVDRVSAGTRAGANATIRDTQINRSSSAIIGSPAHPRIDVTRNATINRQVEKLHTPARPALQSSAAFSRSATVTARAAAVDRTRVHTATPAVHAARQVSHAQTARAAVNVHRGGAVHAHAQATAVARASRAPAQAHHTTTVHAHAAAGSRAGHTGGNGHQHGHHK